MPNIVVLSDRIKEISHSDGTGNMVLDGAAVGFSAFNEFYSAGEAVYYAITDGSSYEVGSGVYLEPSDRELKRFPFRSKLVGSPAGTGLVNFPAGAKEIYVTYPATYSVYTASGVDPSYNRPQASGLAFWESPNILNYDPSIVWDSTNNLLGLNTEAPAYAIDVVGDVAYSAVQASGFIVGDSGIFFPSGSAGYTGDPGYVGGRQLEHFVRNELDSGEPTGTDDVFQLSGVVDQAILFKKQSKGHVFAGPPSGCTPVPGCDSDYPSFRYLTVDDLPDLGGADGVYVTEYGHADGSHGDGTPSAGYITVWKEDNVITFDTSLFFDTAANRLGIGTASPVYSLDVVGNGRFSSNLVVGGNLDVQGTTTYIDSNNVTIWDKQIELASMSGNRVHTDSLVDDAGIVIKSSGDGSSVIDGDKKWVWKDACNAWTAKGSLDQYNLIDVSGIIFNGDCNHLISGAYKPGSGLSLHGGLEFNVGNMFDLGASPPQNIHQGDTILVSGVSGVATILEQLGANHILWVDPTELSGVLQNQIGSSTTAGSGLIKYADGSLNLNVPSGSYGELLAVGADDWDQVIVWDSGSHMFTYMSLGELQAKIDTTSGGSTWSTIDVNDSQGTYSTWGTSDVSTTSAAEALHLVAGDHMSLSSSDELVESAVRFTNTGTPIVSGMIVQVSGLLDEASGVLDNTIDNLSGLVHQHTAGSGLVRYSDGSTPPNYSFNLNDPDVSYGAITAGGATIADDQVLVWDDDEGWKHMTLAQLQTAIDTTGAGGDNAFKTIDVNEADAGDWSATENVVADSTTDTLNLVAGTGIQINSRDSDNSIRIYSVGSHTVSGMFVEGSGALNNKIDAFVDPAGSHSGIAVFNADNELVDTYNSGSGMFWDSGNASLSIGASGGDIVSSLFINTVSGVRRGLTIQASSPQTENLFEVRGPDGAISGLYIDGRGDLTGRNSGRGNAEFFAGRNAARSAVGCGTSVFVGNQAGWSGVSSDNTVAIGGCAAENIIHSDFGVFLGENAGKDSFGKKTHPGAANPSSFRNVAIGSNAMETSSGVSQAVAIGYQAGRQALDSADSVFVGPVAGNASSGCYQGVYIGDHAGHKSSGDPGLSPLLGDVAIGYYAGATGSMNNQSVFVGYEAGVEAVDAFSTNAIGEKAGKQSVECSDANMMGTQAGAEATGCKFANMIGFQAGMDATGCSTTTMVGHSAGLGAEDCDYTNMIGSEAGYSSEDCNHANLIGKKAGYRADGCDTTNMIGEHAGYDSESCHGVNMMGSGAGSDAVACEHVNMIGNMAGWSADNCYMTDMIGNNAGWSADGCQFTVMIGTEAGGYATLNTHSGVMLGFKAGNYSRENSSVVMIGQETGLAATGCEFTNMVGYSAGRGSDAATYCDMFGYDAGGDTDDCAYQVMIGYAAGHGSETCSTGVMLGTYAGKDSVDLKQSIAIGYYAGSLGLTSPCTGVNNVYIGTKAGQGHGGNNNISLIADTSDEVNRVGVAGSDDKLNIANTIYGQIGEGRRISIGQVPADFIVQATLAVKPYDSVVTTPTCWLMNNDNQSYPILMTDTSVNLNDATVLDTLQVAIIPENNSFPHINADGHLTIPMFVSSTQLLGKIPAVDNPGAIAFFKDGDYYKWAMSDGVKWYSHGKFNTEVT